MNKFIVWAAASFGFAMFPWTPVQAANVPAWCANSGYDNGPALERGPGTGPYWQGDPLARATALDPAATAKQRASMPLWRVVARPEKTA
jgi:hypothetical protein